MEATGRDGGWGPSWSYRGHRETGTGSSSYTTSSSSRSGTIVSSSTAYTSSSRGLFSGISMDAALQLDLDSEVSLGTPDEEDAEGAQPIKKGRTETEETLKEMRMKHIESLVQEFSSNIFFVSDSALERWFSELRVSWVLQLDVGASSSALCETTTIDTGSWIRAFTQIMETIHFTESFFPDHGHGFVGMPGVSEQEVESGKQANPIQFALFFQKAMTKMLVFVDVLISKSPPRHRMPLTPCLPIYDALSEALSGIRLQFHSSPSAEVEMIFLKGEVEKIEKEMVSLLSEKQGKAFEAIWSTLEETRTRVLKSIEEDSLGTETPQGSSDIHEAIFSAMDLIDPLLRNESTLTPLVSQAVSLGKYLPQTGLGEAPPFISLIMEMVSCLEEKLIAKSQSFLDKGLGLFFLLNNSNFIRERLKYTLSYTKFDVEIITLKDELGHYIESYIQVSWAPMLSCLFNPRPLYLVTKYSPVSKFESEFQKTYTTQKLWKVRDPELRKRLRKSIIEKVIPGYTKYIEDNKVTNPKFTPQELEEMLKELFEG